MVVGTHRLRDLQLLKPEKPTVATKLGRRLTSNGKRLTTNDKGRPSTLGRCANANTVTNAVANARAAPFAHNGLRACSSVSCTMPQLTPPHPTAPHLTSPHLTAPYLTSPHLTSPHFTSPHLTAPHLTAPHLTSPHLTSPHLTSAYLPGAGQSRRSIACISSEGSRRRARRS